MQSKRFRTPGRTFSVLLFALFCLPIGRPLFAGQRVALLMGIGACQKVPTLPNAPNDADHEAAARQWLGFAVTALCDGRSDDTPRNCPRDAPSANLSG
jgi:hypothetical protein